MSISFWAYSESLCEFLNHWRSYSKWKLVKCASIILFDSIQLHIKCYIWFSTNYNFPSDLTSSTFEVISVIKIRLWSQKSDFGRDLVPLSLSRQLIILPNKTPNQNRFNCLTLTWRLSFLRIRLINDPRSVTWISKILRALTSQTAYKKTSRGIVTVYICFCAMAHSLRIFFGNRARWWSQKWHIFIQSGILPP